MDFDELIFSVEFIEVRIARLERSGMRLVFYACSSRKEACTLTRTIHVATYGGNERNPGSTLNWNYFQQNYHLHHLLSLKNKVISNLKVIY